MKPDTLYQKEDNIKKCERCGKENANTVVNPYIKDMTGEEVEITLCDDCYYDLAHIF